MSDITDFIKPTLENIREVKKCYNVVLKRLQQAGKFLDDSNVSAVDREKYIITFNIEILDVGDAYINTLRDWNVPVSDYEIINGFKL